MIACDQGEYLKEEAIIQFFDIKDQYRKKIQLSEGQMQKIICDIINQDNEKVREDMERIFGAEEIAIESAKLVAMDIIMGCVKYPMTCFVFDNDIRQEWNFASLLEGFGKIDRFQNKDELTNFMVKTFELLMIQNHNDGDQRNHVIVDSIVEYIRIHYAEDLSLDDLSNQFHLSKTYIGRLLKTYVNKSFVEILTEQRLMIAELKIREGKYKEYEVAGQVGYNDFSYFIKVFKKKYGITPTEYKKSI